MYMCVVWRVYYLLSVLVVPLYSTTVVLDFTSVGRPVTASFFSKLTLGYEGPKAVGQAGCNLDKFKMKIFTNNPTMKVWFYNRRDNVLVSTLGWNKLLQEK